LRNSQKKANQSFYWITDIWSNGYFHWMTDAIPRLLTIQDKLKNSTLLLPGNYRSLKFIIPSLKPFTIKNIEFVDGVFRLDNLNMPSHTAPTGNFRQNFVVSLRDRYTAFNKNETRDPGYRRIYISRGIANRRKISNEKECLVVFEKYGFRVLHLENHSFEDQVRLVSNAEYLVSNHGAGLTNMLFMNPGSRVLELRRREDKNNVTVIFHWPPPWICNPITSFVIQRTRMELRM